MDVRREQRALADGCHIVVGTPGRLRDHLERGRLDSSRMRAVVLDEADEMLDLGFREDLEFILDALPQDRRTLLFSATLPKNIVALARRYQRDAVRIDTLVDNEPHSDIEYRALRVAPNEIELGVVNVLRFYEKRNALVFCKTREAVRHLHASLQERGFSVVALSGELTQNERSNALQSLRDGRARVCVATDVAARGIDLPDLGLVVHAELPNDHETLLHRSGRTGRAGRKGVCVLLVPFTRRRRAEGLIAAAGVDAEWANPPTVEEIRGRDQERLLEDPAWTEEALEEDVETGRVLIARHGTDGVAAALARMHRQRLPAPEDLVAAQERGQDRGPRSKREERETRLSERTTREDFGSDDMVWFTLNVGRRNNADPRWLLPIICRLGHVTKREVGPIRIQDRDTRFGIVTEHAARFSAAIRKSHDEDLRIEPAGGAPSGGRGAGAGKGYGGKGPGGRGGGKGPGGKAYGDRKVPGKGFKGAKFAKGDKPAGGKPFEGKPFEGKSFEAKPDGFKQRRLQEEGPEGSGSEIRSARWPTRRQGRLIRPSGRRNPAARPEAGSTHVRPGMRSMGRLVQRGPVSRGAAIPPRASSTASMPFTWMRSRCSSRRTWVSSSGGIAGSPT